MSAAGQAPGEGAREAAARIVIALDPRRPTASALEVALAVADEAQAALRGVFVESASMLRVAEHPFALEVAFGPGGVPEPRVPTRAALERELRRHAEEVRRVFEQGARASSRSWDFVVRRGAVIEELARAAVDAGLLAVGLSRGEALRAWWGTDLARLAVSDLRRMLFVPDDVVLRDGAVLYLATARDDEPGARVARDVAARTGLRPQPFVPRGPLDAGRLVHAAWACSARLVVLGAEVPGLTPAVLRDLIGRASCAVLVVR